MSSNLLCIQKRKSRAALRAHRAWQRLQGQPLQRARTALAEFVLVCRTLKISLQKSKGCDWLREASASIRQAGVHGGLAEAIAFANATRYRNGETAQWDGTLAAKPTKAGQPRDMRSTPRGARQTSQDGGRRNVPFDGSRARSHRGEVFTDRVASALGAASMTWAAAERSASRCIEEARQARQWVDDRRGNLGKKGKFGHPPQSPRRRETAGCSNARSA
jgi:hypothetical protein